MSEWTLLMKIVLVSSAILGFVLQLTAYEQQDRRRNTIVGTLGGLLLGSLAAAQQNEDLTVAFLGVGAAAGGATAGWFVAFAISWAAVRSRRARGALLFLNEGPSGVGEYMTEQERDSERKRYAVQTWTGRYGRMVRQCCEQLESVRLTDRTAEAVIVVWMRTLADTFNYLMLDLEAPTSDRYHLRTSVIVFERENGATGKHWLTYSGMAEPHDRLREFQEESVAYRVAVGTMPSPSRVAAPSGTEMRVPGEARGAMSYRGYSVARVSDNVVLSIDWEKDAIRNEYLDLLESVVEGHLADACGELLKRHTKFTASNAAETGDGG